VGVFILLTKLKVPTSSEEGKFFCSFLPELRLFPLNQAVEHKFH
jgi:hypothetical protein